MTKTRNLQVFKITGGDLDGAPYGLKVGDEITIAGHFEPTWWERMKYKPFFVWCWAVKWRTIDYFSNLWAAICGRRDDY